MTTNKIITKDTRSSEKGNVLFLILIAVALFAALSYAVTQSTRSGGGDASKETNLVNAAGITQYPASIKTAITRMIVSNSIDPANLLFDTPATFTSALTTALLQSQAVFYPTGGGATFVDAPASVMQSNVAGVWSFNSENRVVNIGTTDGAISASDADIIAFLVNVKKAVCDSIHGRLGIALTYPTITTIDVATDMDAANTGIGAGGGTITSTQLDGQPQGCFISSAGPPAVYTYYHVVVER
jgi:hypothetical protein